MENFIIKNGRLYFKWLLDEIPISICKYTSLSALKIILRNNSFKFRNPTEFDDPFDCNLEVKAPKDLQQIRTYLANAKFYKINSIFKREMKAKHIFDNIDYYNAENTKLMRKRIKNYGVHCFTPNSNNFKMWEQYADNHEGVCLGFNVIEDLKFFETSHNVKYVDEYPVLNTFDPDDNMLIDLMTIKNSKYSYEEEVRVWKNPNLFYYHFNKSCLKNIALGYKLSQNDDELENILKLIREGNYPEVRIYKSFLNTNNQNVIYNQINY